MTLVGETVLVGLQQKKAWFHENPVGLFIHWGHASAAGWELSWQATGGVLGQHPALAPVPFETYFANAATFNPTNFDAEAWAEQAQAFGAGYVVFTTKHHDGFAMFDTAQSEYSITKTSPFGRDVFRELSEAFRMRGIRVGAYFSLVDWHHPDYPTYTDDSISKPYVIGDYPRGTSEQWARYRSFLDAQVTELLTDYGRIDLLWFDGEFEHTAEEWDFGRLRQLVRQLQPDCIVNDRCVGFGDYSTPEQQIPIDPPAGPWEACLTMNSSWGYLAGDNEYKSATAIIHLIVEAVSKGGNLLLNVGPTGLGDIPDPEKDRLDAVGAWRSRHDESISGVERGLGLGHYQGWSTQRVLPDGSTRLYLHLVSRPYEFVRARDIPVLRIARVWMLASGTDLNFSAVPHLPDIHQGLADPHGELTIFVPEREIDPMSSVIVVEISNI